MKKYFRIELTDRATGLCETLAVLAAKANGGKAISLTEIYLVAQGNKIQYPTLNDDIEVSLISDCLLHIDRKKGESYETVCRIEQVEMTELAEVYEFAGYGGMTE